MKILWHIQFGYLYLYICVSHFVHRTKRHGNDLDTVLPGGSETTKNFGPRSHLTRGRQLLLGQEFLGRLIGKEERSIWRKNPLSKNIKIFDEDDHHDDSRLLLPISLFYIIAIIFKKVKYYRCLSNAGVSPRYNVVNPSCLKTSFCYLDSSLLKCFSGAFCIFGGKEERKHQKLSKTQLGGKTWYVSHAGSYEKVLLKHQTTSEC